MVDRQVAATAYATARRLGASDKVMLALFEAGLVESGFENLNHGDRDSLGFLQQRPSQGWGTREQILNVEFATTSFVNAAKLKDKPAQTPGYLAQAVQRSAFGWKYDLRAAEAAGMLTALRASGGSGELADVGKNLPGAGSDAAGAAAQAVRGAQDIYTMIDKTTTWISDPKNVRRIGEFGLGMALIVVGVTRFQPVRTAVSTSVGVARTAITSGASSGAAVATKGAA